MISAGTETAVLVLASATPILLEVAVVNATVQLVFPEPVNVVVTQENALKAGPGATAEAGASVIDADF